MAYTTISSFSLGFDFPENFGTSATLGIFCTEDVVADDGKLFLGSSGESLTNELVAEAAITISAGVGTVAAFSLPKTDTASPITTRYFSRIFTSRNAATDYWPFTNMHLRNSLGNSINFQAWWNDNQQVVRRHLETVPTTDQMNTAIAAAIDALPPSSLETAGNIEKDETDTAIRTRAQTIVLGASFSPVATDREKIFIYINDPNAPFDFIFFTLPDPITEDMPDSWYCDVYSLLDPDALPNEINSSKIFLQPGDGVSLDGRSVGFSIPAGQGLRVTLKRASIDDDPLNDTVVYYTSARGWTGFLDNAAQYSSLRSLGTGSLQAAAGDDSGIVDARAATSAATPSTIAKRDASSDISFGSVTCDETIIAGLRVVGPQSASIADAIDAATTMARLNDLLAAMRAITWGAIAPLATPAAPSVLTAVHSGETAMNLAWTDNATNESGFKIERKLTLGGSFAEIATVGANVVIYGDTGLLPGSHYYYRVRATNAQGNSAYSNTADDTTSAATIPTAPSVLAAQAIGPLVRLTWTDNSTNETSFRIERKVTNVGAFAEITSVAANVVTYDDSTVSVGTSYDYRVRARNTAGDSAYSNTAVILFQGSLNPPSDLTATYASGSTTLTWTDNSTGETGFHVYRKTGAGSYFHVGTALTPSSPPNVPAGPNLPMPSLTTGGVSFIDNSGFAESTTYTYKVRAFDPTGESEDSNTDDISTGVVTAIATTDAAIVATLLCDINVETGGAHSDGDTITGVTDSAPAANHLIQISSDRNPTYKTSGPNSKAYIRNNAAHPTATALNFTTPMTTCRTIFAVVKHDSNLQVQGSFFGNVTGDTNAWAGASDTNDGRIISCTNAAIGAYNRDLSANAAGLLGGTTRVNGHKYPIKWAPKPGVWSLFTFETSENVPITTVLNDHLLSVGPWQGGVARVVAYSSVLTQAQRQGVEKTLMAYFGLTTANRLVIFDGDSITAGVTGVTHSNSPEFTFPYQTIKQLNASGQHWDWVQTSVGSQTIQMLIDDFDTEILPLLLDENRDKRVVVLQGGGNDLGTINQSLTVTQKRDVVYARMIAYAKKVIAVGGQCVVCTLLPSNPTFVTPPADFEEARQAINTLLRADVTNFAGLIDNGSNSGVLGCPTCADNETTGAYSNTYYIDGTHPRGPSPAPDGVVAWDGNGNVVMGENAKDILRVL